MDYYKKVCGCCGKPYYAWACPNCKPSDAQEIASADVRYLTDTAAAWHRFWLHLQRPYVLCLISIFLMTVGVVGLFISGEDFPSGPIALHLSYLKGESLWFGLAASSCGVAALTAVRARRYRLRFEEPAFVARYSGVSLATVLPFVLSNVFFAVFVVMYLREYFKYMEKHYVESVRRSGFTLLQVPMHVRMNRIKHVPGALWRVRTSTSFTEYFKKIAVQYKIPLNRAIALEGVAEAVILGLVHKNDFIRAIQLEANVMPQTAMCVADEVCLNFFAPNEALLEEWSSPNEQ